MTLPLFNSSFASWPSTGFIDSFPVSKVVAFFIADFAATIIMGTFYVLGKDPLKIFFFLLHLVLHLAFSVQEFIFSSFLILMLILFLIVFFY